MPGWATQPYGSTNSMATAPRHVRVEEIECRYRTGDTKSRRVITNSQRSYEIQAMLILRSLLCSSGFVPEFGNDTELLHQPKRVPLLPLLNDSPVRNAVDGDAGNAKPFARRSNAHELSSMGTSGRPPGDDVNIIGELVLYRSFGVRKGHEYSGKELPQSFSPEFPYQRQMVNTIGVKFGHQR